MNCNWTGRLLVTLSFVYISRKKLNLHDFKASSEEVIVMRSEKMIAKYMEDVWKSFFANLHAGILQLHYELTSSQIIFKDFD